MKTIALDLDTSIDRVVAEYLEHWAAGPRELDESRAKMKAAFSSRTRSFAVGTPDTRE